MTGRGDHYAKEQRKMQGYKIKIQNLGKDYEFLTLQTLNQIKANLLLDFSQEEIDKAEITELSESEVKQLREEIEKEMENW